MGRGAIDHGEGVGKVLKLTLKTTSGGKTVTTSYSTKIKK